MASGKHKQRQPFNKPPVGTFDAYQDIAFLNYIQHHREENILAYLCAF